MSGDASSGMDGGHLMRSECDFSFPDYSMHNKWINESIYSGSLICARGLPMLKLQNQQVSRMESLFGLHGRGACIDWLSLHDAGSFDAVKALLVDALATGKWAELPDELQGEYHRLKSIYMTGLSCTGPTDRCPDLERSTRP